jgi:hypothetical protein
MNGTPEYFLLQIRLTVTAGYFGLFPEPELILWLRAVMNARGKMLVVQPVEALDAVGDRPRQYVATELSLEPTHVANLLYSLRSIGFPGRVLEIDNTGDPETIWWARVAFQVITDGDSGIVEFDVGPRGIAGRDASDLKKLFQQLWAGAGLHSPWSDLLGVQTPSDEQTT